MRRAWGRRLRTTRFSRSPPLLIIVIAVAGIFFGQDAVRGEIASQLGSLIGSDGAEAVQGLIASASTPKSGLIGTWSACCPDPRCDDRLRRAAKRARSHSGGFPAAPKSTGILEAAAQLVILSFGLVLGLGFLLLVSLVISAALAAFGSWSAGAMGEWEWLFQFFNLLVRWRWRLGCSR
jgi:membrane protein